MLVGEETVVVATTLSAGHQTASQARSSTHNHAGSFIS